MCEKVSLCNCYLCVLFFKVTVLLNRRGVVSFEQLLLDISEALGFPRWHRARVTRLYTSYAIEVRLSHGLIKVLGGPWAKMRRALLTPCSSHTLFIMYFFHAVILPGYRFTEW